MKRPTTLLCILLFTLPFSLKAQEQAEDSEDPVQAQQTQTQQKSQPSDSANRRQTTKADEYEATEEISEDLSVSYPIDI